MLNLFLILLGDEWSYMLVIDGFFYYLDMDVGLFSLKILLLLGDEWLDACNWWFFLLFGYGCRIFLTQNQVDQRDKGPNLKVSQLSCGRVCCFPPHPAQCTTCCIICMSWWHESNGPWVFYKKTWINYNFYKINNYIIS